MEISRRDLALAFAALSTAASARAETLPQLGSKVYPYESLPVRRNGENTSRAVLHGKLHSGFPIEVHITNLGPGQMPHPPHQHEHEELMLLKNGVLDITIKGETTRVGPGSVVLVGSNDHHGWRNPGPEHAEYFIVELGRSA